MRLLNSRTKEFKEFPDCPYREYAILSHTWSENNAEEVVFSDMTNLNAARLKAGWKKIEFCCRQAIQDRIDWVWIDTCCIDKSSSAELTEAINSMFKWYRKSLRCYVYLSDASNVSSRSSSDEIMTAIQECRWFQRAWTLQELLAPFTVHFYSSSWAFIGTKATLRTIICQCSKIDETALYLWKPRKFCVSQIMQWAETRESTRIEDHAYSLMGLFEINMPIIYGEGLKAFQRLQEHILKQSTDHTLLAHFHTNCIAPSAKLFWASEPIAYQEYVEKAEMVHADFSCSITPQGVKLWAHIIKQHTKAYHGKDGNHLAVLRCSPRDQPSKLYALPLRHLWHNEYQKTRVLRLLTIDITELAKGTWQEICITREPLNDEDSEENDTFMLESLDDVALKDGGFTFVQRPEPDWEWREDPLVWLIHGEGSTLLAMIGYLGGIYCTASCDLEVLDPTLSFYDHQQRIQDYRDSYKADGCRSKQLHACLDRKEVMVPRNKGWVEICAFPGVFRSYLNIRVTYRTHHTVALESDFAQDVLHSSSSIGESQDVQLEACYEGGDRQHCEHSPESSVSQENAGTGMIDDNLGENIVDGAAPSNTPAELFTIGHINRMDVPHTEHLQPFPPNSQAIADQEELSSALSIETLDPGPVVESLPLPLDSASPPVHVSSSSIDIAQSSVPLQRQHPPETGIANSPPV